MSELQVPGGIPQAGDRNQPDNEASEHDPETWYGLVWRIVRIAIESNGNLVRTSVLIIVVGGALWLVASVVK